MENRPVESDRSNDLCTTKEIMQSFGISKDQLTKREEEFWVIQGFGRQIAKVYAEEHERQRQQLLIEIESRKRQISEMNKQFGFDKKN